MGVLARKAVRAGKVAMYRVMMVAPVDRNLAVFSAYWDRQYAGNPRAISDSECVPSMWSMMRSIPRCKSR